MEDAEDGGAGEQADGERLARVEQHVREVFANWRKYVVRIRIYVRFAFYTMYT